MQIIAYLAVAMLVGLVSLASHAHEFWICRQIFSRKLVILSKLILSLALILRGSRRLIRQMRLPHLR